MLDDRNGQSQIKRFGGNVYLELLTIAVVLPWHKILKGPFTPGALALCWETQCKTRQKPCSLSFQICAVVVYTKITYGSEQSTASLPIELKDHITLYVGTVPCSAEKHLYV